MMRVKMKMIIAMLLVMIVIRAALTEGDQLMSSPPV